MWNTSFYYGCQIKNKVLDFITIDFKIKIPKRYIVNFFSATLFQTFYLSQFRPKTAKLIIQHFLADGLFSFIRPRG
jgi:hypothetical protein